MLRTIVIYYGIGLTDSASQFFYFYLVCLLIAMASSSVGYFVSSIFSVSEDAVNIAPVIVMPMVLFGGYFSNSSNYPVWISWLQWLSPVRYGHEALCLNEFENRVYGENDIDLVEFLGYDLGIWRCLLILASFVVFCRLFSMLFLRLMVSKFQ